MSILNIGEGTSPLERAILTHYWTSGDEYRGNRECWTELEHKIVTRFLELELLKVTGTETDRNGWSCQTIKGNRAALEPYMRALAAVPPPVQTWVVP